MVKITENRGYKYTLYSNIYLVEGITYSIVFIILPVYLKNYKGLSDLAIAILAGVALLPIIFKPLVAVLTDNYPIKAIKGRRKPYMIFGFILNGITLPLLGFADPIEVLHLFLILWVLQSLGISFMDVAIDALVTETFEEIKEKVNANITFYIANLSGIFILIPISFLIEVNTIHLGLHLTPELQFDIFIGGNFKFGLLLSGIICLSLIVPVLFLDENGNDQAKSRFSMNKLKKYIRSKHIPTLIIMFFILNIDNGLTEFTLDPFFRISGLTISTQLLYFVPSVCFAILGGISTKLFVKRGIIKSITYFAIVFAVHYLILYLLTFFSPNLVPIYYYTAGIIVGLISNAAFILYLTIAMNSAEKDFAATSFILFITMNNLGRLLGMIVAGLLPFTGNLKIGIIFLISAILMVVRIPIFVKLKDLDDHYIVLLK